MLYVDGYMLTSEMLNNDEERKRVKKTLFFVLGNSLNLQYVRRVKYIENFFLEEFRNIGILEGIPL